MHGGRKLGRGTLRKIFSENWANPRAKTVLLFFGNLIIEAEEGFCLPTVWPIRFFALAIIYGHEGRPPLLIVS